MKPSFLTILVTLFLMLLIIHSSNSQLPYPDLVMEITYTTPLTVEEEITLPVTVRNKGGTPATNITIAFIEPEPGTFNVTPFETEAPEVLSPSENMTGGFKLIPLRAGNFTIYFVLTYFDLHGTKYQSPQPASINLKVSPASTSIFDYRIIIITLLVIISGAVCMFYLATRKKRRKRSRTKSDSAP